MCGRFARASELETISRLLRFDTSELTELYPRYNVAPTQAAAAVGRGGRCGAARERRCDSRTR
jgi:putative SOS response-associated peptidase YedK